MKIKHKVVKEFQYLSPEKKIFVLKAGTILEEYDYKMKSEVIPIDREIVDNNPEFFEVIDWKSELLSYMRANKMPQPAQLGKKLIPFIEEMVISSIEKAPAKATDSEKEDIDLSSREKKIREKEEEIEIRLSRIEKREAEYKKDIKDIDERETYLREKSKSLADKSAELEDIAAELREKERNIGRSAIESSKEIDKKYSDLQKKIDSDMKDLAKREKKNESRSKALDEREALLESSSISRDSRYEEIEDAIEDSIDMLGNMKDTIGLLSDFNTRPFTMEYILYIHKDLSEKCASISSSLSSIRK